MFFFFFPYPLLRTGSVCLSSTSSQCPRFIYDQLSLPLHSPFQNLRFSFFVSFFFTNCRHSRSPLSFSFDKGRYDFGNPRTGLIFSPKKVVQVLLNLSLHHLPPRYLPFFPLEFVRRLVLLSSVYLLKFRPRFFRLPP